MKTFYAKKVKDGLIIGSNSITLNAASFDFGEGYVAITTEEFADIGEAVKKRPHNTDDESILTGRFDSRIVDGTVVRVPDSSEREYHVDAEYLQYAVDDLPPMSQRPMPDSEALEHLLHGANPQKVD